MKKLDEGSLLADPVVADVVGEIHFFEKRKDTTRRLCANLHYGTCPTFSAMTECYILVLGNLFFDQQDRGELHALLKHWGYLLSV